MTSCITLPHAMRFMADLAAERFKPIAEGFGVPFDTAEPKRAALACADRAAAFIAQFDLPQRLRDVGVPEHELPEVTNIVHEVMDAAHVVDRAVTKDDLVRLLTNASGIKPVLGSWSFVRPWSLRRWSSFTAIR